MKKLKIVNIILLILVVATAAVSVYFMFGYQEAEAKQPDIVDEINVALMRLDVAKEENVSTEFEQELAAVQATRKNLVDRLASEPLFPKQPASVEINDLIVDSVQKLLPEYYYGLLKLVSNPEAGTVTIKVSEDYGGTKYNKAEYEVRVKGDIPRINSLIGEIEACDFATLTIDDMNISYEMEKDQETGRVTTWWIAEFTVITLYQE